MDKYVKNISTSYYLGLDRIVLEGRVPYGRGSREVAMQVSVDWLLNLAKFIQPVAHLDANDRAHAFYHSQRPGTVYPCSQCPDSVKLLST